MQNEPNPQGLSAVRGGPIVQNEPNFANRNGGLGDEGRMCETKPIWEGVGRGRPTYQEPIMRNKAKLERTGASGQRRPSYVGRLRRKVEHAKQSQKAVIGNQ